MYTNNDTSLNESHLSSSRTNLLKNMFDKDDYMKFKLYENVKSLLVNIQILIIVLNRHLDFNNLFR